jgi:hypothetical protein
MNSWLLLCVPPSLPLPKSVGIFPAGAENSSKQPTNLEVALDVMHFLLNCCGPNYFQPLF